MKEKLLKKYYENVKYGMFSHETLYKKLQGNKTNALMSDKEIIGDSWYSLSPEVQYDIIEELYSDKDNDELSKLYSEKFNLNYK